MHECAAALDEGRGEVVPIPETLRSFCERSKTARFASTTWSARILLAFEQPLDGLQREARRHLAAGARPSHPRPRQARDDEEGVLVALADLADVRRGADTDLHRLSSRTVLPTFTTSPAWTSRSASTRRSLKRPVRGSEVLHVPGTVLGYRRACTCETYVS